MADEVLDIELRVKIDNLRAELEKIPGISKRESGKMAAAWSRDYKKLEGSAAKAAKAAVRSAEQTREAWKSTGERTASLMGGVFGDISDSILDLGGRLGETATSMGGLQGAMVAGAGGAAALAAAAGFGAHAFLEWMGTSEELRESLEGITGLPPLDPQHIANLNAYEEASRDANAMITRSTLQLQAEFAPALTEAKYAVIGLTASLDEMAAGQGGISGAFETFQGWMETVNPAVYLYNSYLDKAAEKGEALATAIEHVNDEFAIYGPSLDDAGPGEKNLAKWRREAAAAAKEASAEETRRWMDGAKNIVATRKAEEEWGRVMDARQAKGEEDWESNAEDMEEAAEAWRKMSNEATAYADALQNEVAKAQQESMATMVDATVDFIDQIGTLREMQARNEEEAAARLFSREMDRLQGEKDRVKQQIELGKITASEGKAQIERLEDQEQAKRAARRKEKRDHKDALMEAYKFQKAAAIARAAIDAAANAVALTSAFAFLGPLAPVAATGVAVAQFELQRQIINQTPPPKFATGGMVRDRVEGDHAAILAEPNEAILTPRGVAAAGGPNGVASLNNGAGAGGSGPTRVYLDSRLLGEVIARTVESDQRITTVLERSSGAIPGQRR